MSFITEITTAAKKNTCAGDYIRKKQKKGAPVAVNP